MFDANHSDFLTYFYYICRCCGRCIDHSQNNVYYGMSYKHCICGVSVKQQQQTTLNTCSQDCSGDASVKCGYWYKYSVYQIAGCPIATTPTTLATTTITTQGVQGSENSPMIQEETYPVPSIILRELCRVLYTKRE